MDGLEVCRRLRADPRTTAVPVIMFTAKTQVNDKVAGFEAGADEYLTKPIHPEELITRVEALLARAARLGAQARSAIRAKMLGFLGCKGGVGTSTLALNVAISLARGIAREQTVMLVELRNGAATLALQMGLRPQQGLQQLAERAAGALDAETVLSHMDRHASGVMVLGSSPMPLGVLPMPDVARVEAVFRRLGEAADYVVVDMGSGLDGVNRALLRLLRYVVVVTEPQRVALLLTQSLLASLDDLQVGRQRVGVAMVHRAPSATTLTKEMATEFLQREVIGVISPAPELAFQAAEQGVPMVMLQAESLPASQIGQLAEIIAGV